MPLEDWTAHCTPVLSSGSKGMPSEDHTTNRQRESTESVTRRQANVLFVRDYSRQSVPIDPNIIGFSNYRKLGSFRIEDNQSYCDSNCKSNLIKDTIDFELISKMNINLMDGFESSSLIKDYKSYKQLKWQYFLKWVQRSACLENRSPESLPHFISFGGLFTSLMSTPNHFESWTLLVSKFKDCIFMNKIRLNEAQNGRTERMPESEGNEFVDKNSFLASKLTKILTQQNQQSFEEVINEYEKHFICYETQIGEHRLLLMSEMDAIDEEGNQYEIKCANHMNFGQKLFNWWSHCVVADIDYILIGLKDNNQILKSVDKLKVEELPEMPTFRWNTEKSFDFVNRVLDYIKQLVDSASDLDVFKVWFKKKDNCVRSVKLPANYFLPNWFTGHTSEETDDKPMDGF